MRLWFAIWIARMIPCYSQCHGCKIVHFPRKDFSICEPARQTAIDAATSKWILVVDADEVVSPELHDYLYGLIREQGAPQGLYIPRKSYFMGKFMHCFYPDYQLRFFIKQGTYWPPIIHADPYNRRQGGENSCREERLGTQSSSRWQRAVSHRQDQSIYRERGGEEKEQALWYAGIVLSPIGSLLQGIRAEGWIPRRQGRIGLCLL